MFASKKRCDFLLNRCEQSASHADLPECQLAGLNGAFKKNGGSYKCVLEYREAAMALSSSGRKPTQQTLERLAFADKWMNGLLPALTRQISIQEWQEMLDIYSVDHVYGMPHHRSQGETRWNEYWYH